MIKGIKHILITYLLVSVVFASTGIQIFSTFCRCTNAESITVLAPKKCCTDHSHNDCPSTSIKANCCSQSSVFLKFTDYFLEAFSFSFNKDFYPNSIKNVYLFSLQIIENPIKSSFQENPVSPHLYGKTLVYRYHSIKIPCA